MIDSNYLKECQAMVDELNDTKGSCDKASLMRDKYSHLKPLIKRVWDPDTKTNVTAKGILGFKKDIDEIGESGLDLFTLFDKLCERELSGDAAKASILVYIEKHKKYKDLILQIMEKKIRIRMGEKMISQIFPDLFKVFSVMLAEDYDPNDAKSHKRFLENVKYCSERVPIAYLSAKIDGVRLIVIVNWNDDDEIWEIEFKSRSGTSYTVFNDYIGDALREHFAKFDPPKWVYKKGIVFDGEWIAIDPKSSNEDFKLTVSLARRKEITSKNDMILMKNSIYKMFDILTPNEFYGIKKNPIFSIRKSRFNELRFDESKSGNLEILEQRPYKSDKDLSIIRDEMKSQNKEGVMIRFNTSWEAKRSRYLMKLKFFMTEEFRVIRVTIDSKYKIPNDRGGEDTVQAINNVIIEYKECEVSVGSGFTTDERIRYTEDPKLIIGKLISVEFQEYFQDQKTKKWSLRCPIFKAILGDKRDF
jgi:DNA ligase-1